MEDFNLPDPIIVERDVETTQPKRLLNQKGALRDETRRLLRLKSEIAKLKDVENQSTRSNGLPY